MFSLFSPFYFILAIVNDINSAKNKKSWILNLDYTPHQLRHQFFLPLPQPVNQCIQPMPFVYHLNFHQVFLSRLVRLPVCFPKASQCPFSPSGPLLATIWSLFIPNSSTLRDQMPLPFICQYPLVSKCTNGELGCKTTTTPTSNFFSVTSNPSHIYFQNSWVSFGRTWSHTILSGQGVQFRHYLWSFLCQSSMYGFNNFTSSNRPQPLGKITRGCQAQLPGFSVNDGIPKDSYLRLPSNLTLSSRSSSKKAPGCLLFSRISAALTVSWASIPKTFTSLGYSTKILGISTSPPLSAFVLPWWCVSEPLRQSHICSATLAISVQIISTILEAPSFQARQLWHSRPSKNFSLFSVWTLHRKRLCPFHPHGLPGSPVQYHWYDHVCDLGTLAWSALSFSLFAHCRRHSTLWSPILNRSTVFCYRLRLPSTHFHVWPTKHFVHQLVSTPLSIIFRWQIRLALVVPFPPTFQRRDTYQIYTLAEQPFLLVHWCLCIRSRWLFSGAVFSHSFSQAHLGAVHSRHQYPWTFGSQGGFKAVGSGSSWSALYSQLW